MSRKPFWGLLLLVHGIAQAHFTLVSPASVWTTDNGGKGAGPCGTGTESNVVTEVAGGHVIPITLREFVYHPGHYRVALAVNSRAELPPDPAVVASANNISIRAAIQNPLTIPVLADGLFTHTSAPSGDLRAEILLPNLNCENCTLQIIEFMAQHSPDYFYRHCATLKIKADPNLPPADAPWPRTGELKPTSSAVAHVAYGGGWQTSITLLNLDTVPAPFTLNFWNDSGEAAMAAVSGTIAVGGSRTVQTDSSPPGASTGWAQLTSPQAVDGVAIFRLQSSGQEAAVALLPNGAKRFLLPFESGPGLASGIAIANLDPDQDTTISVTIRNEQGQVLSTSASAPVALARRQHTSFVLSVPTDPQRGVVEVNSATTAILVLGIRSNNGAFTSIQAIRN